MERCRAGPGFLEHQLPYIQQAVIERIVAQMAGEREQALTGVTTVVREGEAGAVKKVLSPVIPGKRINLPERGPDQNGIPMEHTCRPCRLRPFSDGCPKPTVVESNRIPPDG